VVGGKYGGEFRITNKLSPIFTTYHIESNTIKQVSSVKYLGITINEKLYWSEHISNKYTEKLGIY